MLRSGLLSAKGLFFIVCLWGKQPAAQLQIANVFSHDMVIQRDQPVPVWGTARPGVTVTVHFAGQTHSSEADAAGYWIVRLSPLPASLSPQEMHIQTPGDAIQLKGILTGDVWLCSGQSNMEYPLDRKLKHYAAPQKGPDLAELELKALPKTAPVRYLYAERTLNKFPLFPAKGWISNSDSTVRYVSAIGYFFAKEIYQATGIPIGIISSSWGGTRVEQWTPPKAYSRSPLFSHLVTSDSFRIDDMKPGQMFRGMIEPLLPMAIRGVLWYQGESNCIIEDQDSYPEKMRIMEEYWREIFHNPDLPFYTVQLVPYLYSTRNDPKKHSPELLPLFREAQTACTRLPHTYMVVTTDLVDNLKDIHPSYKWTVAQRLAGQALQQEYGQKGRESFHPQLRSVKRRRKELVVEFSHAEKGFAPVPGDTLSWFSIAGKSGNFVPARARINGRQIGVSAAAVSKPRYIRFAWRENALPDLFSSEGLPAIPFRTDRFK